MRSLWHRTQAIFVGTLFVLSTFLPLSHVLAQGRPSIVGTYTGTGTQINFACVDPADDGVFGVNVTVVITEAPGHNAFTGTATLTSTDFQVTGIALDITVFKGEHVSGTFTAATALTTSSGSFQGKQTGNTLTVDFSGQNTSGDTCGFHGVFLATRPGPI